MLRTNSKTLFIFASRKGFKDSMCCSVNMALLARLWIIFVIKTKARLTPSTKLSFGNKEDEGIEIAGPINRRKTILPTPI